MLENSMAYLEWAFFIDEYLLFFTDKIYILIIGLFIDVSASMFTSEKYNTKT